MCSGPLTYFSPCHAGCSEGNKTIKVSVKCQVIVMTWISLYMFTVFCPAHRYLVTLFCAVSFQGFFSFSKCACVTKTEKSLGEAKKGTCAVDCGLNFVFFLSILALLPFLTSLNDTPATIVTLRFVYPLYSTRDISTIIGDLIKNIHEGTMGNSRKYPYLTTDGFHVLTPPPP